jgi:hypothetical protein
VAKKTAKKTAERVSAKATKPIALDYADEITRLSPIQQAARANQTPAVSAFIGQPAEAISIKPPTPAPTVGLLNVPIGGEGDYKDSVFTSPLNKGADAPKEYIDSFLTSSLNPLRNPPAKKEPTTSPEMQDAFAMLKDLFIQYDLEELVGPINELMISGVGPAAATLALKTDPKYNKDSAGNAIGYARRFAGNELRRKQGLNVLSEAEYLALENSYSETLTSYGLMDYFGPKGKERTQKMAEVIGANVSAVEFNERIQTASNRVINTDKATRDSFKLIYGITDADLTRYFLDPKNNVNVLKEKVATAEIYGAAVAQGLSGSVEISTELAKLGVDKDLARQGYSVIAEVLPEATKLSQIYEELPSYTQQTAEAEVFQGLASAQRTRQRLAQREIAAFSGESGLSKTSLTKETGGRI